MGYIEILLIAALILMNGFFVSVEFALVKVRTTQIDQLVSQGNWAARLTSKAPCQAGPCLVPTLR